MVTGAAPGSFARFAELALTNIEREFPYAPAHVWNSRDDSGSPREYHPVFYGCFDWHSAVHSHWLLVRVLRRHHDKISKDLATAARDLLNRQLDYEKMLAEAKYCARNTYFERTYGWAWVLKLAEEIHHFAKQDDCDAKKWKTVVAPLVEVIEKNYMNFLPRQARPIRSATHQNTAFGISMALDYARAFGRENFEKLLCERAIHYYGDDEGYGATSRFEPGGNDFFSPTLTVAELMSKVLPRQLELPVAGRPRPVFAEWFSKNFPGKAEEYPSLLNAYPLPADTDGQIIHLVGLNFSRSWCMNAIGDVLTDDSVMSGGLGAWKESLKRSAVCHLKASWDVVASGDYMGEHWLGSFAVYAFDHCFRQ